MADYVYIVWGEEDSYDSSAHVVDIYRSEKRAAKRSERLQKRTDALRAEIIDAVDLPFDQYAVRLKRAKKRYQDIFEKSFREYRRFWYTRMAVRP